MADAKTISDAIDEAIVDDVDDVDTEETEEADDSEVEEGEGTLLDEDDEESEEGEDEEEEARTGDVEGEETEDEAVAAPGDPDIFDDLTPEQIAEIKANPALNTLRKSLMRGYSSKTAEHNQLVQLGQAYRRDPQGVLKAIADSLGMQVVAPGAAAAPAAAAVVDPGKELEDLFGPQIGPKVRAVFDKWAETRIGGAIAPLRDSLGKVNATNEQARMYGEETAFKARHKDVTPKIEAEIVALGNSGKIVPGTMTPSEYLDTLYDVVMARRARMLASTATRTASTKLASKIEANRRDREPSGVSGRGGTIKKVSRIPEARSISEALDMAMQELENER